MCIVMIKLFNSVSIQIVALEFPIRHCLNGIGDICPRKHILSPSSGREWSCCYSGHFAGYISSMDTDSLCRSCNFLSPVLAWQKIIIKMKWPHNLNNAHRSATPENSENIQPHAWWNCTALRLKWLLSSLGTSRMNVTHQCRWNQASYRSALYRR